MVGTRIRSSSYAMLNGLLLLELLVMLFELLVEKLASYIYSNIFTTLIATVRGKTILDP